MRNKKALTIRTLVIIVILVISFTAIIFFFAKFGFKGEIDKDVCHQSAVYKATAHALSKDLADLPLNCKKENICIVVDKILWFLEGNCDKDFEGEEYKTVAISGDVKEWDNEINKIFAGKLSDAWWQALEGENSVFARSLGTEKIKKVCVIYYVIAFGDDVEKGKDKVWGTKQYLLDNNVPNSDRSYWQYLTKSNSNYIQGYKKEEDFLETKEQYAIIFMEARPSVLYEWLTEGGAVAAGAILGSFVPVVGTVAGAGIGAVGAYWVKEKLDLEEKTTKLFTGEEGDYVASGAQFMKYDAKELENLKCGSYQGRI